MSRPPSSHDFQRGAARRTNDGNAKPAVRAAIPLAVGRSVVTDPGDDAAQHRRATMTQHVYLRQGKLNEVFVEWYDIGTSPPVFKYESYQPITTQR